MLGITVRRSWVTGRFFLIYASGMSAFLGILLAISSAASFAASYPLLLPIFGAVGSMGALAVFSSDRIKGVLEYLLAYGVTPRRLFADVLLSGLVLAAVAVGVGTGAGLGVYLAEGNAPNLSLALLLGGYGIPMSFACSAFAATIGMYWTALSSPRQGINSPVGLAPFLGILPSVGVLVVITALAAAGALSSFVFLLVVGSAVGFVAVLVGVLLGLSSRLLREERLLSPA